MIFLVYHYCWVGCPPKTCLPSVALKASLRLLWFPGLNTYGFEMFYNEISIVTAHARVECLKASEAVPVEGAVIPARSRFVFYVAKRSSSANVLFKVAPEVTAK